ncbi:hypothetical protein BC936DRAFT_140121 [Jimgerdemannia flammicorona]|uniref:Armadillo-type protein n=1 Tax=Jimgerdemannia flammicorona TaxID=994334 RepID=A0A433B0X6_9FUNG|nr:hypothetical protein BC936DRAFT_140121 [Jimgerdemannia flammicorona]
MSFALPAVFSQRLAAAGIEIDFNIEEYLSLILSSPDTPFVDVEDVREATEQVLRDAGVNDDAALDQFYDGLDGVEGLGLRAKAVPEIEVNGSEASEDEEDVLACDVKEDMPFWKDGLNKTLLYDAIKRRKKEGRQRQPNIDLWLDLTYDADPRIRDEAIHALCPCQLQKTHETVWQRLMELAEDPDVKIRKAIFHTMCDGSPRAMEEEVIGVIERFRNDKDEVLRRKARRMLEHYRRGGNINIL